MRFTWIALPLLLATLATPGAAEPASSEDDPARTSDTEFAGSAASLPVAAIPASGSEVRIKKIVGESQSRFAHVPGEEPDLPGHRPASLVRVRIQAADRAAMDFLPDLARELNGLLSACTTACPPPESR